MFSIFLHSGKKAPHTRNGYQQEISGHCKEKHLNWVQRQILGLLSTLCHDSHLPCFTPSLDCFATSLDLNNEPKVAIIIWFHLLSQVTSVHLGKKNLDILNYTWNFYTTRNIRFPLTHLSSFRQLQRINRCHTPIHFLWETLYFSDDYITLTQQLRY